MCAVVASVVADVAAAAFASAAATDWLPQLGSACLNASMPDSLPQEAIQYFALLESVRVRVRVPVCWPSCFHC